MPVVAQSATTLFVSSRFQALVPVLDTAIDTACDTNLAGSRASDGPQLRGAHLCETPKSYPYLGQLKADVQ